MTRRNLHVPVMLSLLLLLVSCSAEQPAGSFIPNPYVRSESAFGNLPQGRQWGSASAIHYAGDGMIWVAERCGGNRGPGSCEDSPDVAPILLLDRDGNIQRQFGAGLFVWPHGIFVDHERNL
ncbi:MAG: hypothetical protein R3F26_12445, partial [Gammaproteobacteria bacterium]